MANKLKPLLGNLLYPTQTGFLNKRSILHGFHYAQQLVQAAARQNEQIAIFKADIFKAFDTLSWQFLETSLYARGFPTEWVQQVKNNVLLGHSRVLLNSVVGKPIQLKRGVRQGDPMSPYLFNLAMDLLPRWIKRLNDMQFLIPPFPSCNTCLLYADDTLIFLKPSRDQAEKIKLLFALFGQASGLKINAAKSELAVTSASLTLGQSLANVIQCRAQTLPINYLGLPLSDKRLLKSDFLPILDRIENSLTGWRASLLSMGGRLILTNAVLTTIPQYFMSVFMLPKWLIRKIDHIRRRFFWHGHKQQRNQKRGLYMVNWAVATRPRSLGGLGIRNLQFSNHSLLVKWLWNWNQHDQPWWKQITIMSNPSDRPWNANNASQFWRSLKQLAPVFDSSVCYQTGNGNTIKFWHDNWAGSTLKWLFPNLYQVAMQKENSVGSYNYPEGWTLQFPQLSLREHNEKQQLMALLQDFQTNHAQDQIRWLRHQTSFSVGSAYNFLTLAASPDTPIKNIWQIKAPLRVQIFGWLLLANRLTTTDNLTRRGWQLPNMCAMCKADEESAAHLFQTCPMARETRKYIRAAFGSRYNIPHKYTDDDSTQLLLDSAQNMSARQWEIVTCFVLWRERCRRIFSDKEIQLLSIVREVYFEWQAWFRYVQSNKALGSMTTIGN